MAKIHHMSRRRVPNRVMVLVLALVVGLMAVGAWFLYRHEELQHREVLVLGHAGSGFFSPFNPFNPYPANSMTSILVAMEQGADGVEVDVQLSKDGVPFLYHDVDLASMTAQQGLIEEHMASEVRGLRFDGGLYNVFQEEEVITLETLLQHFATYPAAPYLHIDLRNHDTTRHAFYARTLMALLREYKYPLDKLAFISPNPAFLEAFREVEPEATLLIDTGGDLEQALEAALTERFDGICANGRDMTPELVQEIKQHGLQVVLFGGKSHSRIARMINMRPDAIQVNHVAAMRGMLDE